MGAFRLDSLRWALVLLILLSLSRFHIHLGIGQFRPALVLAGVCAATALFNPRLINAERLLSFWPARIVLALGVVACLSAPFGISLGAAATFFLENYLKVIVLTFLIIAGTRHVRDLRAFVWAYVASCGILAYFAIFVFRVQTGATGFARLNSMYTFDSNDIATVLMSGLPLTLLVYQTSRGNRKLLAGVVLLGIGATMARSGSRGGFLAFLTVGLALLLWAPGVAAIKRVAFVGTAVIGLVVAAPTGYWNQMTTLLSPKEDYNWDSYYGRRRLAERGMGYMMRYPVFGLGIGNFQRAEGSISEKALTFVDRPGYALRWRAVHNSYVQVGAEMGVTGLALWVSLLVGGIASMRRLRRRLPAGWIRGDPDRQFIRYMTTYLPISLIGFAVAAFWVSFAYVDVIYILIAFVVGVHIALADMQRRAHPLAIEPVPPARSPIRSRFRPRVGPAPARAATAGE